MSLPMLSALFFQLYLSGVHLPRKNSSVGRISSAGIFGCARSRHMCLAAGHCLTL